MSVSFSSYANDSLLLATHSSMNSVIPFNTNCFFYYQTPFNTFNITKILLLLPLCIFVLHHGLQQWWQHRSVSPGAVSHSDSLTYQLATMEIICVLACFLNFCSSYMYQTKLLSKGLSMLTFTSIGEVLFHILTCLERYMAVVHPITYMSWRKEKWVRIRNIITGFIWMLSLGLTCLLMEYDTFIFIIGNFFFLLLSLTIVSFCSISVLYVLIRPGPGKRVGGRERIDQSKQRAFYTIGAILGVLVLRFAWDLIWAVLYMSGDERSCFLIICGFWVSMPSSLALPLLFILNKKKLHSCM